MKFSSLAGLENTVFTVTHYSDLLINAPYIVQVSFITVMLNFCVAYIFGVT
jgi:hypothetical protein